jgi:hypothetical protein
MYHYQQSFSLIMMLCLKGMHAITAHRSNLMIHSLRLTRVLDSLTDGMLGRLIAFRTGACITMLAHLSVRRH